MADNPQIFDIPIGNVKGPPGNTGNGISSIALLQTVGLDKTYRITMTDETHYDFTVTDGNGISGVTFNPETYTLTLTFDDGTSYTTGSLRGAPGAPGNDGISPAVTITTITGGHRVTITDRDHPQGQTFDVMDGAGNVTSVAGKTGAVTLDGNDVSFDQEDDYDDGTVGKALKDELNAISQKAPLIINTASGNIASFADGADNRQIKKIVGTIAPQQSGTGDPSPDNVRPISGRTGANVYHSGLNVFDTSQLVFTQYKYLNGSGEIASSQSYAATESFYPCAHLAGQRVATNIVTTTNSTTIASMAFYSDASEDSLVGVFQKATGGATFMTFVVPTTAKYLRACYTMSATPSNPAIVTGNTIPDPIPPFGTTLPINWQSSAGTIYGGTVTLYENESVDVVADCANYHILPQDWSYQSSVNAWFVPRGNLSPLYLEKATGATGFYGICDGYPFAPSYANLVNNPLPNHIAVRNDGNAKAIYCMTDGTSDTRPVEINIVLKVAEPVTYHFDNIGQMYTYFGANNIWTDTGSITECDYPADTKLYVDGLTEPDEDMIADGLIASGKYFTVNNQLYLSTAQIAAGAQIIPGSNCTATSITEALNALNS